ncbi:MAG: flippase-like domain-containing protein [Bacteroidetes bacterium]|nr:flippase-like domain-containing protein [Bacteroidota bacterium]
MKTQLIRAAKILVSAGLVWVIFRYFWHIQHPEKILAVFLNLSPWVWISALFACMLNWYLESVKWRWLVAGLQPLSAKDAFRSTLAGAAVSNILPFRVGEYLGRIMYLHPDNRIPAAFNSVFGSMMQMSVTILFGVPAALTVLNATYLASVYKALLILAIVIILFTLLFLLLRRKNKLNWPWLRRLQEDVKQFSLGLILRVFLISVLRYWVFALFYVWLLSVCGALQMSKPCIFCTDYSGGIHGVQVIYLLQSFTPGMAITDAGLRTTLPLLVFRQPDIQAQVVAAAVINYASNLILPSLMGLVFILFKKAKEV